MLLTMVGLVIACDTGRAQNFVSPGMSAVRSVAPEPKEESQSWLWLHAGVAVQVAGSFADWATSWKQPEGNPWLAQAGGQYAGTFYRSGTARRAGLSGGLAVVSYALAWKWPQARKYIGVFNMVVGGGFGAAAVSNVVRNPYYKP